MAQTAQRQHSDDAQDLAGGLVVFAAVILVISGVLNLLRGIMGIAGDDVFLTTPDYTFQWDTTGWGWAHLILGAVSIAVAAGLFRGALWARVAGVVMASLLLVANFLSLPYYPIWSIVLIALCALVVWALSVYRRGPV
ncbi:hypothetical protein [Streptomyces sp. CNQ085]|uniref:DUF7144 family membrane protein n=1 Tax=Streptomyces sp. CNQ085 TaxID=2886944 RepID=UPI001F50F8F7|nr:hypothetical protein [Streptomyces sp. CNQ085]MCI0385915.1 hypothetical protein [Streptomyces sp. CNQ085]